jgi:uncharacterized protein involved in exopolysaccharide biosynthesis
LPIEWISDTPLESDLFKIKGELEIGCYPLSLSDKPKDEIPPKDELSKSLLKSQKDDTAIKKYEQLLKDNLKGIKMVADEKQRWHLLSQELSQKQELIHRLKKEYDEKTENLKILGNEMVEVEKGIEARD